MKPGPTSGIAGFLARLAAAALAAAGLFAAAPQAQTASGAFIWVADSGGGLGVLDPVSGEMALVAKTEVVMTDIAFAPDGQLYGISFTHAYRIDAGGRARQLGAHGVPCGNALEITPDGVAYAMGCQSDGLYEIDLRRGASRLLFATGFVSAGDLAWLDGRLYLAAMGPGDSILAALYPAEGRAHRIGPMGADFVYGLVAGPDGVLYAGAGNLAYSVDPTTGATTLLSVYRGGLGGAYGWAAQAAPGPNS